jgi:hypothetical protein
MSETYATTTGLTTQYAAQVATDLERNHEEQERISNEIALLQEQLATLQHDHAVLRSIQQALGVAATPPQPTAAVPVAVVPGRDEKAATEPGPDKQARAEKSATPGRTSAARKKPSTKKTSTKKTDAKEADTATGSQTARPRLVDLVREHLAAQREPRSAAEVATALGEHHPERTLRATVVRNTLEGLVAKKQARRSKQGTSVFYTAEPAEPEADAAQAPAASA